MQPPPVPSAIATGTGHASQSTEHWALGSETRGTPISKSTPRTGSFQSRNGPGYQRDRASTPIEVQEARKQALLQAHQDRVRNLAFERKKILHQQALYLGKIEQLTPDVGDLETRTANRKALIEQLSGEQAASEAMLETLKQGESLKAARTAGLAVHHEMLAIRANAGGELSNVPVRGMCPPGAARSASAASETGRSGQQSDRTPFPPVTRTLGPLNGRPQAVQQDTRLAAQYNRTDSGSSQQGSMDRGSNAAAGPPPVRRTSLFWPEELKAEQGRGAEQWFEPQERSNLNSPHHSLAPSPPQSRSAPDASKARRGGGRVAPSAGRGEGGEVPGYVDDLKAQVEALRSMMETQFTQSAQPPAAPPAPPMQPYMQPMMPPWAMPPWAMYPPPPAPPAQPVQPSEPQPRAPDPPPPGVSPEVVARHQRDMALLRMEIEHARTATELEQIKSTLNSLRGQRPPDPMDNVSPRDRSPLTSPPLTPEQDIVMMDVPKQPPEQTDSEDEDREFGDEDDMQNRSATQLPSTTVKADVLHLHVMTVGPASQRGSYRVRAVLYDGFQPLYVGPDLVVGASTGRRTLGTLQGVSAAVFNETVTLRGLTLTPTMMLIFELYVAKQALANMPSKEDLCAWAYCNCLSQGEIVYGRQSLPLYRLPIMISAQRHFTYSSSMLNLSISHQDGLPGEEIKTAQAAAEGRGMSTAATSKTAGTAASSRRGEARSGQEDVPGVPTEAWCRVARGAVPFEPFTPGDGFVVMIDGARFLPANVTITKVVASVYSSDRQPLAAPIEAFSSPDSDAYSPRYTVQATLGQGPEKFDNSTAIILFTVYTMERWTRTLRVVGYAVLPCFLDSQTQQQPLSKNIKEYSLNSGSFQLPLHTGMPMGNGPLVAVAFAEQVPRVTCATLLVRLVSPEVAKQQRRGGQPVYADRVYDSIKSTPTPADRKLYVKALARKPLIVREAARALVAAGLTEGRAAAMGPLPDSDPLLLDWIETCMKPTQAGPGTELIQYNYASEYHQDLGFSVALDAAMRLPRNLPAAGILSFAPPGSFYQDNPVADDLKITYDLDMASCLAAPRWNDGYQLFEGVVYQAGLAVIIDLRLVVPAAGTSFPVGWAPLPAFERSGAYVASGPYQLPLFQGVPSRQILQEFSDKGDVDAVVVGYLKSGRLRAHEECCSVLVRLQDPSQEGQLAQRLGSRALQGLRLPNYVNALGPRFLSTMRKDLENKTYAEAKPANMTREAWLISINECLCRMAGIPIANAADDSEEEDEVQL